MTSKKFIKELIRTRKELKQIYKDNGNPCEPMRKSIITESGLEDVILHVDDYGKSDIYELINPYRIVGHI